MTKGRSGRLPGWAKGRKLYDAIDGSEIYERASTTTKQRGQYIHKSNYDKVLDSERPFGGGSITTVGDIPAYHYDTYTKLISHFDGIDAAIAYSDPIAGPYTFYGTAQLNTTQKVFGTASLLLDGNSDYITLPDSDDWDFGSGNFTIDCRIRFNFLSSSSQVICSNQVSNTGIGFRFTCSNSYIGIADSFNSNITVSWSPVINIWYHVTLVRYGNAFIFFIDGIQQGTNRTAWSPGNSTNVLTVGAMQATTVSSYFNGYIDELRISKGIARWTSNFLPPFENAFLIK